MSASMFLSREETSECMTCLGHRKAGMEREKEKVQRKPL